MPKQIGFTPTTVLMYGGTGSGKSTSIGEIAKAVFRASGGKIKDGRVLGGLRTRLYASDNGGTDSLQHLIDVGMIEVVDVRLLPHPFLWALEAGKGNLPNVTGEDKQGVAIGRWEKSDNSQIGVFAFDSFTSIAERMFSDLSAKAGMGISIGGEGAYNFVEGSDAWGKITIGSSNRMHYNVVHQRIALMCDYLSALAQREGALVLATCTEDRGESETTRASLIGPKTIGKALTAELPRLFGLTLRLTLEPTPANKEPKHTCYLVSHPDKAAGNTMALANRRLSMIKPGDALFNELPAFIEPADVVKAIKISQDVMEKVKAALVKEFA